jgi:hypothetical protein
VNGETVSRPRNVLIFLVCLLLLSFSSIVYAVTWSTPAVFSFADGTTVGLTSASATYDSATNDGSTVIFTNFQLGAEQVSSFAVSLTGNNITLTQVSYVTSLSGATNQLGQIRLTVPRPVAVYSNTVKQTEGTGWSYGSGILTINSASSSFFVAYNNAAVPYGPQNIINSFMNNTLVAVLVAGLVPFVVLAAAIMLFMKNMDPDVLMKAVIVTVFIAVCLVVVVIVASGVQTAIPTA